MNSNLDNTMSKDKPEPSTAECSVCGKQFSKLAYRNRHMRDIHKINSKGEQMIKESFICDLCGKSFGQNKHLQVHLNIIHSSHEDSSNIYNCIKCSYKTPVKHNLKIHIQNVHKEKSSKKFHCLHCKSKFSSLKHLKFHERRTHNIGEPVLKIIKRKCPICPFSSSMRKREEINKHLEKEHEINLECRSLKFTTVEEFNKWKTEIEEKSIAKYIKQDVADTRHHYICHRSGTFQSRSNHKRRTKTVGSCKIGAYCPSEIKVKILSNGSVEVMYIETHVGHKQELKHMHLTANDRHFIATKIINKTPHQEILKTIRDSMTNSELKRIHLVNKKDIFNVARDFNLKIEAVERPHSKRKESPRKPTGHSSCMGNGIQSDGNGPALACEENDLEEDYELQMEQVIELEVGNEISIPYSIEPEDDEFCVRKTIFENKIQELFDFLRNKVMSTEQMDYVEHKLNEIMTTVDAMNGATDI